MTTSAYENISPKKAISLQLKFRSKISLITAVKKIRTVAGVDVSQQGFVSKAAVVLLTYPGMDILEKSVAKLPVSFPYIPGLLAFREIPVILKAFNNLKQWPEIALVDGHGYAHPRRFGLACHLGVILGLPTIGCAKSRLVGEYKEPGKTKGSKRKLVHKGELIGYVVRSRTNVKPVFISSGHMVKLNDAVRITLSCVGSFRLPEPIRAAHKTAGEI